MRKKLISLLCACTIISMTICISAVTTAYAGTYEEECDLVFLKAFEQILSDEGISAEKIEIKKDPVYDLSLNQLGYVYSMDIEGNEGFALIINTDGVFNITEIYLDAECPYNAFNGQKIYVTFFLYLVWEDGEYIETTTGLVLENIIIDQLQEKAFCATDNPLSQESEVIYYTSRIPNEFKLAYWHPAYLPSGITNGCTPAAGGNIIGYYTRFFPELIPGFNPGNSLGDYYLYIEDAAAPEAVIKTLYNYMGTNTVEAGTTIAGFRTGMTRYCAEKNRSISYNSCMQSGSFNFDITKQRFQQGLPVVLFVDTFTVADMLNKPSSSYESINYTIGNLCHAMAGFGYNEIIYKLTNGQTRIDKYITVATGLGSQRKGYFNINYKTQIDECYSINIY